MKTMDKQEPEELINVQTVMNRSNIFLTVVLIAIYALLIVTFR